MYIYNLSPHVKSSIFKILLIISNVEYATKKTNIFWHWKHQQVATIFIYNKDKYNFAIDSTSVNWVFWPPNLPLLWGDRGPCLIQCYLRHAGVPAKWHLILSTFCPTALPGCIRARNDIHTLHMDRWTVCIHIYINVKKLSSLKLRVRTTW